MSDILCNNYYNIYLNLQLGVHCSCDPGLLTGDNGGIKLMSKISIKVVSKNRKELSS